MIRQSSQVLLLLFAVGIGAQWYGHDIWLALLPGAAIAVGFILLVGIANYIAGLVRAWQDGMLDKEQERIDRKNEAWVEEQRRQRRQRQERDQEESEAFDRPLNEPPRPKPKPKPPPKPGGFDAVNPHDSNFDRPLNKEPKPEPKPKPPPPKPEPRREVSKKERALQALIDDPNVTENERANARRLLKAERSKKRK